MIAGGVRREHREHRLEVADAQGHVDEAGRHGRGCSSWRPRYAEKHAAHADEYRRRQ